MTEDRKYLDTDDTPKKYEGVVVYTEGGEQELELRLDDDETSDTDEQKGKN